MRKSAARRPASPCATAPRAAARLRGERRPGRTVRRAACARRGRILPKARAAERAGRTSPAPPADFRARTCGALYPGGDEVRPVWRGRATARSLRIGETGAAIDHPEELL